MKKSAIVTSVGAALLLLASSNSSAGDLSRQEPIVVEVELGTGEGKNRFTPDNFEFQAGKLYKIVIKNNSEKKHYFSSQKFAASSWTRKVEDGGMEIKGQIREIEVKPGGEAAWFVVPVAAGTFDLECTEGKMAAEGMVGKIVVK